MSTVDEWARDLAEEFYGKGNDHSTILRRLAFRDGATVRVEAMAALLLSDEAVEAAARRYYTPEEWDAATELMQGTERVSARAALTAALTKITEDKE